MKNIGKVELAHRLCDSGKFKEALQFFKELERDSEDPLQKAGYLLDEATCYAHDGDSEEAQECMSKARMLVSADPLASAQIDFLAGTLLIEDGQREQGLQALSSILRDNPLWLRSNEGRELYERIQIQRGVIM